jgi:hypothetical protein
LQKTHKIANCAKKYEEYVKSSKLFF